MSDDDQQERGTNSAATRALDRMRERLYTFYDRDFAEQFETVKDELVDGETNYCLPNAEDEDAPNCAHCGSERTWWRPDGDVGCNDCVGITTTEQGF